MVWHMKKTLLIGNFGARNIGDELILYFARKKYPGAIVMTADPKFSQEFCEEVFETISPFPSGIRSLIRFLFEKKQKRVDIDQVVFVGGGLFAIKPQADFVWWCQFWWAKKFFPKAKFTFEYQGVDSKVYFLHKFFTKRVFSRVEEISVRDKSSARFLKSLGIKKVEVREDRVWESLQAVDFDRPMDAKYALFNAKKSLPNSRWKKILEPLPSHLEQVFVCFDPEDAMFVPKGFSGDIFFPHTAQEVFHLFTNASLAMGQRLHFLILAGYFVGSQQTFVLGKPYAEKVGNFCKKQGINVA